MRDRAEAITPTAAALVAAVASRNPTTIEALIRGCGDLPALVVVLADNVGCVHDTRLLPPRPDLRARRRPCLGCGTRTRSTVQLCRTCSDVHASPAVLAGGDWVTRNGVAVYVEHQRSA